jgi:hypothetical protein
MIGNTKRRPFIVVALLMWVAVAQAQTQRQKEALSVQGYPGQALVVQLQGRVFVDLEELARITNGSLSFEKDRIVLTLPHGDASEPAGDSVGRSGFSRPFMRAAIEAMASMREWGGMLLVIVQNGYPLATGMAGNAIAAYQARAAESIALASTAASTEPDYRGLELLRNEFNNAQAWSDSYVKDRSSMHATELTMSERGLKDDNEAQKILRCGQFLAQMFASGTFQDDVVCR